ncbi:MAG: glycosyltransferase family 2 protein [Clostridiales bacterium]|nr:glycosyltransferase family 2 protein [Clostridiales bacterium]
MKATVDVIIPVYKPDHKLKELLISLQNQEYPVHKIIIMNTDKRYWVDSEYARINNLTVRHIEKKNFDHGGTRRQAAALSSADFMVLMTQDAIPADERLILELMKPFSDPFVSVSYARQLPYKKSNAIEKFTRNYNYPDVDIMKTKVDIDRMGIKAFFSSDVCAAYRKSDYLDLGGFIAKAIFNEDMIFAAKAILSGKAVFYASKAQVYHSHNYDSIELFQRNFDLGVSQSENPEIFAKIKSESEGIKLVKKTASHLISIFKPYLLPKLIINSGFKYLGYKLGYNYKKLPKSLILKFTSNKAYWE